MLQVVDLLVDASDDIIIKDDIIIDDDPLNSSMRIAERRLVSRGEDFILDDISPAIEQFIQRKKDINTKAEIISFIEKSLFANDLFTSQDFKILISDSTPHSFSIIIKFTNSLILDRSAFKIIVDLENQRVYRG